jgi:nitrile hydratase accessory protein
MGAIDREVAGLDGPAALPRKNGELVFGAPWEGRAFGMAVALHEKGAYQWKEFRDRLAQKLGEGSPRYYEGWLAALESVLLDTGLLADQEVRSRTRDFKELRRDPVL